MKRWSSDEGARKKESEQVERVGDEGRVGENGGGRDTEGGEDEIVRVATVCYCWLVSMEMEEEKEMTKADEMQLDEKTRA